MNPYRHIHANNEDGVLVLTVLLEQVRDYMIAEELRYELVHAVRRSTSKEFVLDLHNMTFMTSLACVAFIGLKHAVREGHGRLILCNMSPFIRKILHAKRLLSPSQRTGNVAFESADGLSEAFQALKG